MSDDARLILLDPRDNVFVIRKRIAAGEMIAIDGQKIRCATDLAMAHKIARHPIAAGETILKYGAPIGITTADVETGAHVHVHNMRSNYTATHYVQDMEKTA